MEGLNLKEARAIAEKAGNIPHWEEIDWAYHVSINHAQEYIATFNPELVLKLLDVVEAASNLRTNGYPTDSEANLKEALSRLTEEPSE